MGIPESNFVRAISRLVKEILCCCLKSVTFPFSSESKWHGRPPTIEVASRSPGGKNTSLERIWVTCTHEYVLSHGKLALGNVFSSSTHTPVDLDSVMSNRHFIVYCYLSRSDHSCTFASLSRSVQATKIFSCHLVYFKAAVHIVCVYVYSFSFAGSNFLFIHFPAFIYLLLLIVNIIAIKS